MVRAKAVRAPDPVSLRVFNRVSLASCRLERAVVCNKLWDPECQAVSKDLPSDLPLGFSCASHYVGAYEPLIFEEARESVLHSKLDHYVVESSAKLLGYATGRCKPYKTLSIPINMPANHFPEIKGSG